MSMALTAGKELDIEVAEKVMGLVPCIKWAPGSLGSAGGPVMMGGNCEHKNKCYPAVPDLKWGGNGAPPYSTDTNNAWLVVEEMHEKGWGFGISRLGDEEKYIVDFVDGCYTYSFASTSISEAICIGALLALNETNKKDN